MAREVVEIETVALKDIDPGGYFIIPDATVFFLYKKLRDDWTESEFNTVGPSGNLVHFNRDRRVVRVCTESP